MQALAPATSPVPADAAAECARDVLASVPVLMNFIRRHMRCRRAKNLSVPQFRVLVRAEGTASVSEVAHYLGTTLPTASRIVSGLVTKGYVSRAASTKDRRQLQLTLTARGEAALQDAREGARDAVAAELRKHSSDADCRRLSAGLRAIGPLFATFELSSAYAPKK